MSARPPSPALPTEPAFAALGLTPPLLQALKDVGYAQASPIQIATIPLMLAGRDLLGQAQTGTGKTAAFALPILSRLQLNVRTPQALVLVPTRELALQVTDAFRTYATHLEGCEVLALYGGQSYAPQLAALERGAQVVVGTPGRIIDHLDRGTLKLRSLKTVVLDEADEMLRMGFIEDVQRILRDTPRDRQTAMFSATLPPEVGQLAQAHLRDPAQVSVSGQARAADTVRQRYWQVSGMSKVDALVRIVETEAVDAMIVFVKTREATQALVEQLQERGLDAAALSSDLQQSEREQTVAQFKRGEVDVLVATDVAARGLDVDRVSHVLNFDMPTGPESYTHRIGRTGRAGRSGDAILFITAHERDKVVALERAVGQTIEPMKMASSAVLNAARIARFKAALSQVIEDGEHAMFLPIVQAYAREHGASGTDMAAAILSLAQEGVPLILEQRSGGKQVVSARPDGSVSADQSPTDPSRGTLDVADAPHRSQAAQGTDDDVEQATPSAVQPESSVAFKAYRIEVGHTSGIKAANLRDALARECRIEPRFIGRLQMFDIFSLVELPGDLPNKRLKHLVSARVAGKPLQIRPTDELPQAPRPEAN